MPEKSLNGSESARVIGVVWRAADTAYQARVARAAARASTMGFAPLERGDDLPGLTAARVAALAESHRGATPAGFQSFARALHVSARWLAIGSGRMHEAGRTFTLDGPVDTDPLFEWPAASSS